MCLSVPSGIVQIDENQMAVIDIDGVRRQASLMLLEDARVGDNVIVHAGFAIQLMDESAARETIRLLSSVADQYNTGSDGPAD